MTQGIRIVYTIVLSIKCQENSMDWLDFLVNATKVCPKGTFGFDAVFDKMSGMGFMFQETITDKYSVQQIIEHVRGIGAGHLVRSGTDSFHLFIQDGAGILVEAVGGCSNFWIQLDFLNTLKIFSILGVPT